MEAHQTKSSPAFLLQKEGTPAASLLHPEGVVAQVHPPGDPGRKRVLVGMSGGVDSSVSAALLVAQGYDVEGVYLKVWSESDLGAAPPPAGSLRHPAGDPAALSHFTQCPWEEDLADARAVAHQLGIKLHVKNVQREYFARVVEAMKASYAAGETPNPDVLCNSEIKFGLLYDWALANEFDAVATGHYATIRENVKRKAQNAKPNVELKTFELHTSADSDKDQTYFLWRVPRERFGHILFPIGHLQKSEVRHLASDLRLPTADKPDSQGICFLGHVNVHDWLKRELGTQPGPVVTRTGERVGTHQGAALATIGQRHGLGITGGGPVYYVVEKDLATNTLIVDTKPAVMGSSFALASANWLISEPQVWFATRSVEARIRHQGQRIACTITAAANHELRIMNKGENNAAKPLIPDSSFVIRLEEPAFAIAPGQSVVLYSDDTVLGGGIIASQVASSK